MKEEEYIGFLLETCEKNSEWFDAHFNELEEKYQNMFIAIKDQKVVAVSAELEELLKELKIRNENLDLVFIISIPPKGLAFIL